MYLCSVWLCRVLLVVLSVVVLSVILLNGMALFILCRMSLMLIVEIKYIMLSGKTLSGTTKCAECHYVERCYAERRSMFHFYGKY